MQAEKVFVMKADTHEYVRGRFTHFNKKELDHLFYKIVDIK